MAKVFIAKEKDIPVIIKLANKIWPLTYQDILSPEQLTFMLQHIYNKEALQQQMAGRQTFLLLKNDIKNLGFAAYGEENKTDGLYKLHKLYIDPQTQSKGLGRILLNQVIENIKKTGAKTLELNVNRYNKAQGFYLKMGFFITAEVDIPIGKYFMNDYIMQKTL